MSHSTDAKPRLIVDLGTLTQNYQTLASLTHASLGAVVKADGYGLGVEAVAKTLWSSQCRTFFVAFTDEGVELRAILKDAEIYVLEPFIADDCDTLIAHELKPCLFSMRSAQAFAAAAQKASVVAPCALHVETGINRLAMVRDELQQFLSSDFARLRVDLLMSHLACAEDPDAPQNLEQLKAFEGFRRLLPDVRASLANSGGVLLGSNYHLDLVRPGIALYGHDPHYYLRKPQVAPVTTLETRIGQIKKIAAGESVGYGATVRCDKPTQIGVLMGGYADGIMRRLSNDGAMGPQNVLINGRRVPMFGRLSMDLCTVDLSGFYRGEVNEGDRVEIFGPDLPLEELAECAGTIPYEVLTQIGSRVPRIYIG